MLKKLEYIQANSDKQLLFQIVTFKSKRAKKLLFFDAIKFHKSLRKCFVNVDPGGDEA